MSDLVERFRQYADHPISNSEFVPIHQKTLRAAATEIERLTAEVAALKADAERYQWLRINNHHSALFGVADLLKRAEYLDEAIDAALAAQEGKS